MGTIKKGILGGFSGKVGTVVGSSWKGIAYMRSLPGKVRDPRTELQMIQRSKFAVAINYLQPLAELLRTGWKFYANRKSPFNAAMAYTYAKAIIGTYPDYSIDPGKVLISRGSLAPPVNAAAIALSGALNFQWDDNSSFNTAKQTDKALLAVVNPVKADAVYITAGAARSDCEQSIAIPAAWIGDSVEAYMGFISQDGKEIANSVYLGSIIVV